MKTDRRFRRIDELLSAYLDDELSPRERAQLEARLQADPKLRARLKMLQQTVALVRRLPRVQAPRNFLLTPAMVRSPEPRRPGRYRWLAPAFTAASALTALMFLSIVAFHTLVLPTQFAAAPPAPEPAIVEAPREEAEIEVPALPTQAAPPREQTAEERMDLAGKVAPTATLTEAMPLVAPTPPTQTLAPTEETAPSQTSPPPVAEAPPEALGEAGPPPAQSESFPPPRPWSGWPWLAAGLGLATVALAAAAAWAWRIRRS